MFKTLKPNGPATVCKAVLCGFESRRRLFEGLVQLMPLARRRTGHRLRFDLVRAEQGFQQAISMWLAQWVEHQTITLEVAGSTPVPTSRCV
jgi:hypothetical protein